MPKLAILGTIEVTPDKRDQVLKALLAHRARCLKDELTTLQFDVMIPRDDASKLLLHEVYQDDAAFEVHRTAASITRFREETAGLGIRVHVTRATPAHD
jgi:quinol monooxygenase YgiN